MDLKLNYLILIFWFGSRTGAIDNGCPQGRSVSPCKCSEDVKNEGNVETTISCRGDMSLPGLTSILRNKLCGRHLHAFRLESSNISYLPSNLFYKIKVENIRIAFTNISHFTEAGRSAFYGLERDLKSLVMRKCRLVDGLQWQMIGELDVLLSLDLSENELTYVPKQWFENPPKNLRFLYLRANKIDNISPSAFASMFYLQYLDLSDNYISSLERSSFPFPGNSISFLILSYNYLTSLPEDFFLEMNGLKRLYLDNNLLQTLKERTWTPIWGELVVLDLMGNKLKCECDMEWLSKLYQIEHIYGKCREDSILSDRELKSLWPWDFNCSSTDTELDIT